MTQTELPLYPKVSSIYNKIMQLAIAIFIIIGLMNLWVYSYTNNQRAVDEHFRFISQQFLQQLTTSANMLLTKDRELLQSYIDEVSQQVWLKDISLYDPTGQLIIASKGQTSINDLYGLSLLKGDKSQAFTPFIQELRDGTVLNGYLRITVDNSSLTDNVEQAIEQNFDLLRLMMILAGVVGFLLTRGLNRFSRQGYRLNSH